jgi:ribosomal protein S18 acetylase RimI-like enzyme
MSSIQIRNLRFDEIEKVKEFPPREWSSKLEQVLRQHFGQDYFYPIVCTYDAMLVGIAQGIINGSIGWLGNIITIPEYRNKGIGTALTEHLMKYLMDDGCTTQLLVATTMGEPIYKKLGFIREMDYIFFDREHALQPVNASTIREIRETDTEAIERIDYLSSGERRLALLHHFFSTGWMYETTEKIEGFYLPDFGAGFIAAENDEAGLALLRFKHAAIGKQSVLPETNSKANELLKSHGFLETLRAPRMYYGKKVQWQSECIYSRAAGYCG